MDSTANATAGMRRHAARTDTLLRPGHDDQTGRDVLAQAVSALDTGRPFTMLRGDRRLAEQTKVPVSRPPRR